MVEDTTEEVEGECSFHTHLTINWSDKVQSCVDSFLFSSLTIPSHSLVAHSSYHHCCLFLLYRSAYGANNRATVPIIDEANGGGGGGSSYGRGCDQGSYVNFPG